MRARENFYQSLERAAKQVSKQTIDSIKQTKRSSCICVSWWTSFVPWVPCNLNIIEFVHSSNGRNTNRSSTSIIIVVIIILLLPIYPKWCCYNLHTCTTIIGLLRNFPLWSQFKLFFGLSFPVCMLYTTCVYVFVCKLTRLRARASSMFYIHMVFLHIHKHKNTLNSMAISMEIHWEAIYDFFLLFAI